MYEPIFYGSKGSPKAFTKTLLPDNVLVSPVGSKVHPNQKPLSIIKELIENCSVESELGLDPFGGSGTFGVACRDLKRRAVIIEKDKEYYTRAWERIYENVKEDEGDG
jgi:site-specific DNA-methyltransferase (adenine-specific)